MTPRPLTVAPDDPGLHVIAGGNGRTPKATYACGCGFLRTGTGEREVIEIVTGHHQHKMRCPLNAAALAA